MKLSITYYLTLFVLKLKGIKKDFSKDPIDYKKIRKDDVLTPSKRAFKNYHLHEYKIHSTSVTEIRGKGKSKKLVIFIPGGAFISGPGQHHWDTAKEIVNKTNHTLWLCNYPKAPEHKISETSQNINAVYRKALELYPAEQITLLGDSAGGTLITALTQRLQSTGLKLPKRIILVSPVMDSTVSNPEIPAIDKTDPMLSKTGVLSAKKMSAENGKLDTPMLSPINGSFDGFPNTYLFLAENDITYPDQKRAIKKLESANVNHEVIIGKRMPHIWPFLPVMKEAKIALNQIIGIINS